MALPPQLRLRLCLVTTVCVSPFAIALPIKATTLSLGNSTLVLNNFSQAPLRRDSVLTSDAISFSGTDLDIALTAFDGLSNFEVEAQDILRLNSQFQSVAQGEGSQYFSFAEVGADTLAVFDIAPATPFRFDFFTSFLFNNVTDGTSVESASTRYITSLQLIDEADTVLGFFDLTAGLNTNGLDPEPNDFLSLAANVPFTTIAQLANLGGPQEFATATFTGSFQQVFDEPTQLTLLARTNTQACVQAPGVTNACVQSVPETHSVLSIITGGLMALLLSRRRSFRFRSIFSKLSS